jgi:hypothetical protein
MGWPRRLIMLGAALTAIGLAVAGIAPVAGTAPVEQVQSQELVGGLVLLAGWLLLAVGIHRLGRGSERRASELGSKHDDAGIGR